MSLDPELSEHGTTAPATTTGLVYYEPLVMFSLTDQEPSFICISV